jgi:hypothetical protein
MQFILTGFTQKLEFRVFAFEGRREDKSRADYTVKADLGLIRKYGIRVQDLPLLCRALLDMTTEDEQQRDWTYGETEMSLYEKGTVATRIAAAAKKRLTYRPPVSNAGAGWRSPQPAAGVSLIQEPVIAIV